MHENGDLEAVEVMDWFVEVPIMLWISPGNEKGDATDVVMWDYFQSLCTSHVVRFN